jgi:hypothetical protein
VPGSSSLSSSLGSSKNRRSWHPPSGLAMPRCLDVDGELAPGGGSLLLADCGRGALFVCAPEAGVCSWRCFPSCTHSDDGKVPGASLVLPIGLCGLGLEAENGSHRARRRVACRIAARPAAAVSSFAASFSAAAVVSRSYRRAAAAASISTTSETRREPAVASLTAVARALATAAAVAASRAPMSFCVSFSAARIRLCSRLIYSACSSFTPSWSSICCVGCGRTAECSPLGTSTAA